MIILFSRNGNVAELKYSWNGTTAAEEPNTPPVIHKFKFSFSIQTLNLFITALELLKRYFNSTV